MIIRTLFARLMVAMVLLLAVTAGLRTVFLDAVYPGVYLGQVRAELLRNARDVAVWAAGTLREGTDVPQAQGQVRVLARLAGARIWVVDADGLIRMDTGDDPSWEGVRLRPADLAELRVGREVVDLERSPWLEASISAAIPVRAGDQVTGAVFLFVPQTAVRQDAMGLRTLFISTGLFTITVGLGLAYVLSRNIAGPVQKLTRFAQVLGRGRLGEQVEVGGPVEVQNLGQTLSAMSVQLREAFAALEAEKQRMSAIIAAMAEGVLAVGATGRVLLCNPAASRLLDCWPEGRQLEASGLHPLLVSTLKEALRRPAANAPVPLTAAGTEVLALVSSVVSESGVPVSAVVVLQDVTSATGLQRARENFVANVSHELRSPLHGMLLLVDALADGTIPPEMQQAYFNRLRGEVARLQRLTNDLLELSRIDAGIVTIPVEPLDLHYVAASVVDRLEPRSEAMGVHLRNEVPEETYLLGNSDRLEQVLTNLIENAIRFTPEGGHVSVGGHAYRDAMRVHVRDTGTGIPAERLPHIWDRFYKADPARTRSSTGGTGLGLAIVKHLVELQGGEVGVESKVGEGSTFFFILPTPPPGMWPQPAEQTAG